MAGKNAAIVRACGMLPEVSYAEGMEDFENVSYVTSELEVGAVSFGVVLDGGGAM